MNKIWLIGLAVMWQNLVRNIANKNFTISVYNRTFSVTKDFLSKNYDKKIEWFENIKDFINSIERPRNIILLVKAGEPVDLTIDSIIDYLDEWDTIIDCGNSFYEDTERRTNYLKEKKINFIWCWISWWEEGALNWPSIMPWISTFETNKTLKDIFEKISAKDFNNNSCVTNIWNGGAWHFVKMVHNWIEYSIMALIAESYSLLKNLYNLSNKEISDIFWEYNKWFLNSYLIEIMQIISSKEDDFNKGKNLIDFIKDTSGSKWTGLWTSLEGLKHGIDVSSIISATIARQASSDKQNREKLNSIYRNILSENNSYKVSYFKNWEFFKEQYSNTKIRFERINELMDEWIDWTMDYPSNAIIWKQEFINLLEKALYLWIIFSYSQGLNLIEKLSKEKGWNVNLSEVLRIWEGWCIIRAKLLQDLSENLIKENKTNILELKFVKEIISKYFEHLKEMIKIWIEENISLLWYSSAYDFFIKQTELKSNANIIQWMRDYFWAHTYERIDREWIFHTDWDFEQK